ncbi:MAG TPA: hypothetical protein VF950_23975 [Planctomycetota bacterium]
MSAIGAFLLGLPLTFGGYRVLVRLASAVLFAAVAGHYDLDPLGLSFLLGYLLGDALYYLLLSAAGAALGFLVAGLPGAVAGAVLAPLLERPLAIAALAGLLSFLT